MIKVLVIKVSFGDLLFMRTKQIRVLEMEEEKWCSELNFFHI
jgi:hypothetical protein